VIVGVGIDVVAVSRFALALDRTPALAERTLTPAERVTAGGRPRSAESLAARFAAKEALAKALGAPGGLRWHDAEITVAEHGRPVISVRGTVAERARALGVTRWHLSLSHDGGIAGAVVVAESAGPVAVADGVAAAVVAESAGPAADPQGRPA
jgi:holo-[acyl-carrier protein] synthase